MAQTMRERPNLLNIPGEIRIEILRNLLLLERNGRVVSRAGEMTDRQWTRAAGAPLVYADQSLNRDSLLKRGLQFVIQYDKPCVQILRVNRQLWVEGHPIFHQENHYVGLLKRKHRQNGSGEDGECLCRDCSLWEDPSFREIGADFWPRYSWNRKRTKFPLALQILLAERGDATFQNLRGPVSGKMLLIPVRDLDYLGLHLVRWDLAETRKIHLLISSGDILRRALHHRGTQEWMESFQRCLGHWNKGKEVAVRVASADLDSRGSSLREGLIASLQTFRNMSGEDKWSQRYCEVREEFWKTYLTSQSGSRGAAMNAFLVLQDRICYLRLWHKHYPESAEMHLEAMVSWILYEMAMSPEESLERRKWQIVFAHRAARLPCYTSRKEWHTRLHLRCAELLKTSPDCELQAARSRHISFVVSDLNTTPGPKIRRKRMRLSEHSDPTVTIETRSSEETSQARPSTDSLEYWKQALAAKYGERPAISVSKWHNEPDTENASRERQVFPMCFEQN
jgi:hypothetical protein